MRDFALFCRSMRECGGRRGKMRQCARPCASQVVAGVSRMSEDTDQPKFERQFLSPSEIAHLTGIDVSLIRKAIRSGELRAMRMSDAPNSKMRVRQADLWEWVKSKQQTPQ